MKRKIIKTKWGRVVRLRNGRFQIDIRDSKNERTRPGFETLDEAIAELKESTAKKSSGGEFLRGAHNNTFDKALDLLIERNEREGLARTSRDRVKSVISAHLRPVFGARKLKEFTDQRMRFVQEWLDDQATHANRAAMTLAHIRSCFKLAFDEAIAVGLMGAPNPVNEFNLRVPRNVKKIERDVLTLEEISTLIRSSLRRADKEHELTYCARMMLVLIGLLAGLRNGECSGLQWDCIDFEGRMIYIRRAWRKGEGIIGETKTGKSGFRSIPMSPILFAALRSYGERLQSMGHKLEGPVLCTKNAAIIPPLAIAQDHWAVVASKAGFVDEHGGLDHTFYALRHTAFNLWRTVGIQPDRLMKLAGHTDYHTTVKNYLHETPHFEVIRREVELLGPERTPEGYIDALGFVLARRWKEEGIDIGCAPPRSATPMLGYNGTPALPANTIDLVPTVVSMESEASSPPLGSAIKSVEALRLWQIKRANELHLAGWTKWKIAGELGVGFPTVQNWLRNADIIRRGRIPRIERQALMERISEMRRQQPNISANQMAKVVGVAPKRIVLWERRRGKPMPHQPGSHKVGKHDAAIRRMLAEGKSCREMEAILNGPSHSAIDYYIKRLGLENLRPVRNPRTGRVRIEVYETRIRELAANGLSKEEIARELGRELDGPSRGGILGFIRTKRISTTPGNRHKRIAKIEETVAAR